MVIPLDDPSEPCYEAETVQLLNTSPTRKRGTHTGSKMSHCDRKAKAGKPRSAMIQIARSNRKREHSPNHSLARRACIRITRLRIGLV